MKVLIAYATTEGQTRKIAETAATHLSDRGHSVTLIDVGEERSELDIKAFDAFILAGSVHQEQHQKALKNFATAHRDLLSARPSALISVSLSAALEETRPEAENYVERFGSVTGWEPLMILPLGGAVRFTEYDYFQEQVVKFIVMKRGLASEAGADGEFTDWKALETFVDAFVERSSD